MRLPPLRLAAFLALLCVVNIGPVGSECAGADPAPPDSLHRWGIGWDSGIALRFRMSRAWALGLSIDPGVSESASNSDGGRESQHDDSSHQDTWQGSRDSDAHDIGLAMILYRETSLRDWLRAGPYVAVSYAYSTDHSQSHDLDLSGPPEDLESDRSEDEDRGDTHSWSAEVGIRPAFWFHERFVLETRVGLRIRYESRRYDERNSQVSTTESTETRSDVDRHSHDDQARIEVVGREMGPGAVMQFVIFF